MSDPNEAPTYADSWEHLCDHLRRVDLLLRRHLDAWWGQREVNDVGGFYVSDEEVARLLRSAGDPLAVDDSSETATTGATSDATSRLKSLLDTVRERERRSIAAGVELRLVRLTKEFGLSEREQDALLLALAPDLDRKYETVYGYLRDDITRARPTVELIRRVLAGPEADQLALVALLGERSRLVSAGLIEIVEGPTVPGSDVRVRKRVVEYLLGSDAVADTIEDVATAVEPRGTLADLHVDADRAAELVRIADRLAVGQTAEASTDDTVEASTDDTTAPNATNADGDENHDHPPLVVAFVGPDERTAESAVAAVCPQDSSILRVDARALSDDQFEEELATIRREARLQGGLIHVTSLGALQVDRASRSSGVDPISESASSREIDWLTRLVVALDSFPGHVFLSGDDDVSATMQPRLDRHLFVRVDFPRPGYERRVELWRAVDGLPDGMDPSALAGTFRLTSGEIEDAVSTARCLGWATSADEALTDEAPIRGTLTVEALQEGARMQAGDDLDDLAQEVIPGHDWDEIVLPADTLAHLREVAAQIRHRGTVHEEWGFRDRFSLGNGINLLFTGPSGTGKTMAAEIIAGDVGLPMYKLDLSSILSKYIGETEKNIGRIFDAAERGNSILFFDEADALFGKRTEIGDSHDRYANVEVDYLLQRMEEHDGCVIMATNLKENIDTAFDRRINATVSFPMPDEDARARIWELIFPKGTPHEELDVEFLAQFELSGGSIRNVALTAAFMAAADDRPVGMDHLVRALRREFQKTGTMYDPSSFGEYRNLLD